MKLNISKEQLDSLKENKIFKKAVNPQKRKISDDVLVENYYILINFINNYKSCPNKTDLNHCVQNIKGKQDALTYVNGFFYNVLKECSCVKYYDKKWIKNIIYSCYKIDESIDPNKLIENILEKNQNYRTFFKKNDFDKTILNSNRGLYLYGKSAIGKTYILKCIAYYLANNDNKIAITTINDLVMNVKEDFKVDFLKKFKEVKYLFIDDLGSEVLTDWSRENVLFNLINYRYENNLITFFSSNYKIEELDMIYFKRIDDNKDIVLKNVERITTRIADMSIEVFIGGSKLRKKYVGNQ